MKRQLLIATGAALIAIGVTTAAVSAPKHDVVPTDAPVVSASPDAAASTIATPTPPAPVATTKQTVIQQSGNRITQSDGDSILASTPSKTVTNVVWDQYDKDPVHFTWKDECVYTYDDGSTYTNPGSYESMVSYLVMRQECKPVGYIVVK